MAASPRTLLAPASTSYGVLDIRFATSIIAPPFLSEEIRRASSVRGSSRSEAAPSVIERSNLRGTATTIHTCEGLASEKNSPNTCFRKERDCTTRNLKSQPVLAAPKYFHLATSLCVAAGGPWIVLQAVMLVTRSMVPGFVVPCPPTGK